MGAAERCLLVELAMVSYYSELSNEIKDERIKREVRKIITDKIRHAIAVKRIIDDIKEQKVIRQTKEITLCNAQKMVEKLSKAVAEDANSLYISTEPTKCTDVRASMIDYLSKNKLHCIYIAINKIEHDLEDMFSIYRIDKDLDFLVYGSGNLLDPRSLTSLSIEIAKRVKAGDFVIVDTLSELARFNKPSEICDFVSFMNSEAKKKDFRIAWLALESIFKDIPTCERFCDMHISF